MRKQGDNKPPEVHNTAITKPRDIKVQGMSDKEF